jgi:hypothetical protein
MRRHPFKVEEMKSEHEGGGKWAHDPELMRRIKEKRAQVVQKAKAAYQ